MSLEVSRSAEAQRCITHHGTGQTVRHATCDPEFLFLLLIERNDLAAFPGSDRHSLRRKNCTIQNNLKVARTDRSCPSRNGFLTNSAVCNGVHTSSFEPHHRERKPIKEGDENFAHVANFARPFSQRRWRERAISHFPS